MAPLPAVAQQTNRHHNRRRRNRYRGGSSEDPCRRSGDDPQAGAACRRGCGDRGEEAQWRHQGKTVPLALAFGLVLLAVGCAPLVRAASAGSSHTCVVLEGGSIKCWGENYRGQLGQDDMAVRGKLATDMGDNLPTVPLGTFEATYVSSGSEFNCALAVTGDVKCWGRNNYGQLGLGDLDNRGGNDSSTEMGDFLPTVDLGTDLVVDQLALASGAHACAVFASGGLKCWGHNSDGQLGLGDTENRGDEPDEMGDDLDFVNLGTGVECSSVSLGALHTCAVVDDGDVKCWGSNNGGQLGYEDTQSRGNTVEQMGDFLPVVDLGRDQRAIAVSTGFYHTCALLYTGDVKCWGFGSSGQLGQAYNDSIGSTVGSMGDNLEPVDLGTGRKAIAMSLGGTHSCAVLDDNTVKCWGGNKEAGSLGLGDLINRGIYPGEMGDNLPTVALNFGDGEGLASNIFAGTYHTCVSGTEGDMACFGLNAGGQLGAGSSDPSLGDEPGEVEAITAINLGTNAVAVPIPAPGDGVELETISPTPAPGLGASETRAPIGPGSATPGPTLEGDRQSGAANSGPDGNDSSDSDVAIMAAIVSAAVVFPVIATMALCFCCWRRRQKRREGELKGPSAAVGGASGANGAPRGYGRDDSFTSSDNNVEANGDGPLETLSSTPLVKPHSLQSSAPMAGAARDPAAAAAAADAPTSGLREQASIETLENSSEELPRPAPTTGGGMVPAMAAGASAAVPPRAVGQSSDDDDSSRDERSDLENPSELRRSGSNSSISTLGSTSTASSTWPTEHGFVTPARTDIARGIGGRYSGASSKGRSGGHAGSTTSSTGGGVEGLTMVGFKTPGNRGTSIPETPSPRSVSSSVHGTPAPPEMRLAQFARAGAAGGDANLYGLPEMEIGRSTSNVFDSNPAGTSWPVGSKGGAPLTAASIAAAAAGASAAAAAGGDSSHTSPDNSSSPTMMGPTLTPSRARHRGGGVGDPGAAGGGEAGGGGRKSNRASRTSTASPVPGAVQDWVEREGGGGMGAEAAAQAFTEEAELEALQIDKNDLKLVFGRPFARGKSSEVYQVTHDGKNRAAKIIDLFSLGVVGEEVTRLYASFAQELRAMKGIRHECVAAVYGAVATPSELTIVTDLVKRGALRALLTDKKKRESLTPAIRHKIIKDVASGMAYLSDQGVQHRNLHSHNVLITKEWGAKVADYGLAGTREVMLGAHDRAQSGGGSSSSSSSSSKRRLRPAFRAGTLRWTAPELLQPPADGTDPFTEASDVYSVGVIAWEVLCGGSTLPYDGLPDDKVTSMIIEGSTPPVSMETPIGYNKLMLLCWRKNPVSRPTFAHIASVLLKDLPPAPKASP